MVITTPTTLTTVRLSDGTYATLTDASPGATRSHTYLLRLTGYQDVTGSILITAGQTASVTGTFTGNASISSTPSGAEIWIDGSDKGVVTPNTIQGLSPGSHNYTLKLSGYADYSGSFNINSAETTNVSAVFAGSAYFTSVPTGAEIYLAISPGTPTDRGVHTPNTITNLTAASSGATTDWNYRLTLSGYADMVGSFTATAGSTITVPVITFPPSLNITSIPSGASIYIDTVLQPGATPAIITGLSAGSHDYRLILSGYTDYTNSFTATSGTTTSISATFAGSAHITSIPTNASLYLDGSDTSSGTTPITITNLTSPTSGSTILHNYILKLSGYADISGSFTATAGSTINVPTTFPGSASFESNPSGAEIWIDGTDKGVTTPGTITGLSAGAHNYTLKLSGYADYTGSFSITSGETTDISITFTASAYFTSTPSGARIYIDGSPTYSGTTLATITGLSAGTHTYILKLSGYTDYSGSFITTSGTTTPVDSTFAGSVHFTSVPTGASIYMDGSPTSSGTAPLTIGNLTSPTSGATLLHNYILKLSGYADTSGQFTATAGSTIYIPITFAASANITSTPIGASIYLDDSPTSSGVTPLIATGLTAGSHSYTLTLSGYADKTGTFTATAGSTINVPVIFAASANITSTPTGAEIWIDGADQNLATPAIVTGLSAGTRNYTLKLAGYADAIGTFTATAGSTVNVPVTFASSIYFTSVPSGARIWIDTIDQGVNTPATVTGFSEGDHSYTLKLTGYADATGTFTAIPGQTVNVPVTFAGSVHITSTPSGAEIWIGGIDQNLTTPNTVTGLSTGSHGYTLKLTGYVDVTGSFSIIAGTTTQVSGTFTGNLNISSTPSGASIYIDNTLQSGITPTAFTGLSAGSHNYKLTLSGYADATGTFTITPGGTTNLPVTFSGSAYFTSIPSGASIYIDNIVKTTTPGTVTGLSAGSHNYKLTLSGYADATGIFTVTVGQTVSVPVTFSGSAYFTSIPSGASIYIDTVLQLGVTPETITGLSAGSHSYTLKHTGYADTTDTFTAIAGSTVSIPVTFPASVNMISSPGGAEIWIDNADQHATTPSIITGLSAGDHNYTLKLADYADYSGTFTAITGSTITVSPTFLGSLNILSNPPGAEIWIGGVDKGVTTPRMITGFTAGTYNYTLKLSDYVDYSGQFTIVDGEITIIYITFLGSLYIRSTPPGASIYINEVLQTGKTTPASFMGLINGIYDIKLTLVYYYDWIGTATITAPDTTSINAILIQKECPVPVCNFQAT